jgi:hypothetical protein
MSSRVKNRGIAVAVVLGGLILPFPAAASPSRAEQSWERAWSGLFAWLGFGAEEGGSLLTGWSSSYIDPNGGQLPTAVAPEAPEPHSSVGPSGEDR